jgi:flagellar L-ring protein precursor FlgH
MRRWVLAAVGTGGFFAWCPAAFAYAYLFQDNRARQIGDVLTVVITESTVANEQDQRALNKSTNTTASIVFGTSASTGALVNENSTRNFTGNAQLTSNRLFTDTMAVTVVDMMPNGNLVIEGYRSRVVAGEERVLRFTGVVRQQDIRVGNTVPSQAVANFRVSYLGRGPESRAVNQNLVGRVVNLLWPW